MDIVGEIVAGDDKAFERKVAEKLVSPIQSSYPYPVQAATSLPAINIGEFIHNHGWSTYVPTERYARVVAQPFGLLAIIVASKEPPAY